MRVTGVRMYPAPPEGNVEVDIRQASAELPRISVRRRGLWYEAYSKYVSGTENVFYAATVWEDSRSRTHLPIETIRAWRQLEAAEHERRVRLMKGAPLLLAIGCVLVYFIWQVWR